MQFYLMCLLRLTENNYFSACDVLDLAFVVDSSGSINKADPGNYNRLKQFIINVLESNRFGRIGRNGVRVALVKYSNKAEIMFTLDRYDNLDDIKEAILAMPYDDGKTNISGALRETRRNVFTASAGDRPEAPNVLILISDGTPNVEESGTQEEGQNVRRQDITLVTVGITSAIDKPLMSDLASSGQVIESPTFQTADLTNIVSALSQATCTGNITYMSFLLLYTK